MFVGCGEGVASVVVAFAVPLPVNVVGRLPPSSTIRDCEVVVDPVWLVPLLIGIGVPLNPRIVVVPIVRVRVAVPCVIREMISEVEMAVGIERVIVEEYEMNGPSVST